MVSFTTAIKNFYLKAFKFKGRATRAEFWWVELYYVLTLFTLIFISARISESLLALVATFILINAIPMISLQVRRFHDIGYSAWSLLIYMIPYIGGLCCLFLFAYPGDKYANGYEDDSYIKNLKTIETEDVEL